MPSGMPLGIAALSILLYLPLISLMAPVTVGVAVGLALVGAAVVFKLSGKFALSVDVETSDSAIEETLHSSALARCCVASLRWPSRMSQHQR